MIAEQTVIESVKPPPAPARTPEFVKGAIREWIAREKLWPDMGADKAASDIASCYRHGIDAYELAKSLDDDCGWDINADDVDTLDSVDLAISLAIQEARKAWVVQYNIQPPLPMGARVKLRKGLGTIAGLCQYNAAAYLVKEDGCTTGRHRIVKFEDAIAEQSA